MYDPQFAPDPDSVVIQGAEASTDLTPAQESRGFKWCGILLLIGVVAIALLTFLPNAPLRNPETGSILGNSPFMNSLIPIISGLFLLIVQFIAYFAWSNIPRVAAVRLGDVIEGLSIGTGWLMVIVILITLVVDIIIPQAIAKWALLAPIFVPLFMRLGTGPATLLATYRLGDSPLNLVTPIMAYFPLVVVFASRYDKRSGIGTVIALMLPYTIVIAVAWLILHMIWHLLSGPLTPGS